MAGFDPNALLRNPPSSVDEAAMLLTMMGQKFDPSTLLRSPPTSAAEAEMLLRSMGQSTMPDRTRPENTVSPMQASLIKGVDPVGNMPTTLEATKELLRGMGMTGIDAATPVFLAAGVRSQAQDVGAPVEPVGITANIGTGSSTKFDPGAPPTMGPLIANKDGYNLPKTGKVNTTGAYDRINARASAEGTGVKATMGPNGRLTITNIGTTPAASQYAPTVPTTLAGSVEMLRKATDPDTAMGIMANIRQTAALEAAKINADAMTFAGNKLGVPALEQYLKNSEANDRASPSWFPGIGDSPGTAKIRADLNQARSAADIEAKRYLETNSSAATMRATLTTAEAEMARITRIGDRRSNLQDNAALRAQERADKQQEQAEQLLGAVTPDMTARLSILNPQLAYSDDKEAALASVYKAATKNPARVAALSATESQLPVLALDGNPDAISLIVAKEITNNPGLDKEMVENKLLRIRDRANSPGFAEQVIKMTYKDPKEASEALGNLRVAKMSGNKEAVTQQRQMLFAASLEMERIEATKKFQDDTGTWGINDPTFQAAQTIASKNTGRRTMDTVLNAYLDGATGPAAIMKLDEFTKLIDQAAGKQGKSLFGMPDPKALKANAIAYARKIDGWYGGRGADYAQPVTGSFPEAWAVFPE